MVYIIWNWRIAIFSVYFVADESNAQITAYLAIEIFHFFCSFLDVVPNIVS